MQIRICLKRNWKFELAVGEDRGGNHLEEIKSVEIETTMVGITNSNEELGNENSDNLFELACQSGRETYINWTNNNEVKVIDISWCRKNNILPAFTN